jgi:hypothetical protein
LSVPIRSFSSRIVVLSCATLLAASLSGATEPFGHVELAAEWLTGSSDPGSADLVRLRATAHRELTDLTLEVAVPEGRTVTVRSRPSRPGIEGRSRDGRELVAELPRIGKGDTLELELELELGAADGAVPWVVHVSGRDADGRRIHESMALPAPRRGATAAGTHRLGALEFPAGRPTSAESN